MTTDVESPAWASHVQRMREHFPAWPDGFPLSAFVSQYLLGRIEGQLNISGRPEAPPRHPVPLEDDASFAVLDDADGSVTAAVLSLTSGAVTVYADFLPHAQRLRAMFGDSRVSVRPLPGFPPHISAGLDVRGGRPAKALLVSPKAQAAVADYAAALRPVVDEFMVVGRDKHLFRGINTELARTFERVDVTPGRYKSRMIIGSTPDAGMGLSCAQIEPNRRILHAGIPRVPDFEVSAYGACFGGAEIDGGSGLLLRSLAERHAVPAAESAAETADEAPADRPRILDLGCGNGWLLTAAAHVLGPRKAVGVDASAAALASARLTAEAGMPDGVEWSIEYSDAGEGLPQQAFDVVVLNPPFHSGHEIENETARQMMRSALAVVRPGGRAVVVFNSALRYRPVLERLFGKDKVEQWARDWRFTVLAAVKS